MAEGAFQHPYLPNTPEQRREMLKAIGVSSVEELFADIPAPFRDPPLRLPPPLPEPDLRRDLEALAGRNITPGDGWACFLGGGAYRHFSPAFVRHLIGRGEFLTSYTPYQPEASQGTLQATYEFQSLVCLLTGMEVANAGMYDGATALAEAALMACRVTGRDRILALDTVNPRYLEVVRTYAEPQGLRVEVASPEAVQVDGRTACLLVQSPNYFGYLEDLARWGEAAHREGALFVVSVDPISLGLFRPPADFGADIVVGECQPLGLPLSFGGPYVGLFACRERYLRQMPGRVVGRTVDREGRIGYVLTLQTREQHIRRERATSNICTAQALMATAAAIWLCALGKQGLRRLARLCWQKAHRAARRIAQLPGYSLPPSGIGVFFKEFVVQAPATPEQVRRHLLDRRILAGVDVSHRFANGLLLAVTEMNTEEEIDRLVSALAEIAA